MATSCPAYFLNRRRHCRVLQMLLDAGSDVNKASTERETALHYAARHGHTACISLLLDCPSIDVNARNMWGLTPLMLAASGSRSSDAGLELVGAGE